MESSGDFNNTPELDYDGFIDVVRSLCGRYTPGGIEPETFSGRVRAGSICGFKTVDFSCNAHRIERMHRDVHFDGMEHYYAIFQTAGQSTILQNDQAVELAVGDVALVDAARPVTYVSETRNGQWLSLQLPRQSLISHLGIESEGGCAGIVETLASRLCFRLVQDAVNECDASPPRPSPPAAGDLLSSFLSLGSVTATLSSTH